MSRDNVQASDGGNQNAIAIYRVSQGVNQNAIKDGSEMNEAPNLTKSQSHSQNLALEKNVVDVKTETAVLMYCKVQFLYSM